MQKKILVKSIIILTSIFILGGCSLIANRGENNNNNNNQDGLPSQTTPATIDEQLATQSKIQKFDSLDELKEFLEENDNESSLYSPRGLGMDYAVNELATPMADTKSAMPSSAAKSVDGAQGLGGGGSDDFSKTNVQVEGVDEADVIKTDGEYVYAVVKNNLFIINAYPAEKAEIISKIEFKSRPQDIYINGDKLVVYGNDNEVFALEEYKNFKRRGSYTFLKVFDITDKKNPKQVRNLDFEGSYNNSRMIGDYVYFVTTNYNYYYMDDEPALPRVLSNSEVLSDKCDDVGKCLMPDIYYFNIPYPSYDFTTITAINVVNNNESINREVYLMSSSQNMYVSQNNIYITYTKYISEYQLEMEIMKEIIYSLLSLKNQEKISKIEQTENFILNSDEKRNKIERIIENFRQSLSSEEQKRIEDELKTKMEQKYEDISKELEKTVIHKIGVNKENLEYKTSGEVAGQILNQFSMDESNGYFRIATTKNQTWSRYEEENRESYNNLYVLDENLKVVGTLENLAEGERIYSVRFMQDRAYLVTFKQVDPLFVIDLSNPKNPKVLGKLKIPGYSSYLHPYDSTTLIGLGKDTGESEWGGVSVKGLKLSLFDVADVSNPKEIDTYIMGDAGSDSIALSDHKAFLFSKEKNLLSIPVSIRESTSGQNWGKLTFSGAAVLKVDKTGFELRGKIDHSDGGQASSQDYWRGYNYYDNTVKRSLYIDDVLYTFSNKYLKMNKLNDLELVKKIELEKNKISDEDDFIIVN